MKPLKSEAGTRKAEVCRLESPEAESLVAWVYLAFPEVRREWRGELITEHGTATIREPQPVNAGGAR